MVLSAYCQSSSSCRRSVVGLHRLLVFSLVARQSSLPSCLICRRRVVSHAVCQSSVFVVIGRHCFVVSPVIVNHCYLVGCWSSSPYRSVIGLLVIVGHQSSSSRCRSIVVFVWHCQSVISPRQSLSSVNVVHDHHLSCCRPESIIDCHLWSPVGVRCLWSSVICGCPSPIGVRHLWSSVDRCLLSVVVRRPLTVIVRHPSSVVCGCLWSSVDHHPSSIVCGRLSIVVCS